MIKVGQVFTMESDVTEKDIQLFGEASQDYNPLHFQPNYATGTIFKEPIAHGILSLSRISALLGTRLVDPQRGYVVYRYQDAEFIRPVKAGDHLKVVAEVTSAFHENHDYVLAVKVLNQKEKEVVVGTSKIKILPR